MENGKVPIDIWGRSKALVKAQLQEGIYPADEWFILTKEWELRMWIDTFSGKYRASVYPVRPDGHTLTQETSHDLDVFHVFVSNGGVGKWICKDCGKLYENTLFPDDRTLCAKTRARIARGEF